MAAPLFDDGDGPTGGRAFWVHAQDGLRLRLAHWPAVAPAEKGVRRGDPTGQAHRTSAASTAQEETNRSSTDGKSGRGTVILLPGRTEYVEKYAATAADFAARGLHTITLDWRGQGLSDRLLKGQPLLGHIGDFSHYQRDLDALFAAARALDLPRPWVMVAHSMGGAIGLTGLTRAPVTGVAFTAPMWGLGLTAMRRAMAWGVSAAARRLGQGHSLTPGVSALSYVMNVSFEPNDLTSDAEQFAGLQRQLEAHPELALGGPSLGWLGSALEEVRRIRAMSLPAIPAIVALGSEERIVHPAAIKAVASRWPSARLDIYQGARHEIMMERAVHRERFLASVEGLF